MALTRRSIARTIALAALVAVPRGAAGQAPSGWTFEDSAFADLWFHGLAVVGFDGFGPLPLHDPAYARRLREERVAGGGVATPLERERGRLLAAFRGDEAFEVLHFVPLYFAGADRAEALDALRAVAAAPRSVPDVAPNARVGARIVAGLLAQPRQRETLGSFVAALDQEWSDVVEPRRRRDRDAAAAEAVRLRAAWERDWAAPLADFLRGQGLEGGTAILVPALGAEGRFLQRGPSGNAGPLVALGARRLVDAPGDDQVLASLLREMCYPAVRRAFGPFEGRMGGRIDASRASDLAATRCGELLLERRAPGKLAAYRTRFSIPAEGLGPGFLSVHGRMPAAAAWERQLEQALLRELQLDPDAARAPARPPEGNP